MEGVARLKKKHRKKHSYWLVKSQRTYTSKEVGELLDIHVGTVRSWRKVGLKALPGTKTLLLFHGAELKRFLRERALSRRCKLADGEFYCMRCKTARESSRRHLTSTSTERGLGYSREQVIHKGKCTVCGAKMVRFGSQERSKCQSPEGNCTAGSNTFISERMKQLQPDIERSIVCKE